MLLTLLLLTLSGAYLTPLSTCQPARISYYTFYNSESARCQLGTENVDTMFRCAPNTAFLNKASQCGICYEAVGEVGSVRFMVTDECPAGSNSEHCSGDYTHFDMASNAFPSLCDTNLGLCNITYRMVACDHTGNIKAKLKDGSSNYYIGVIFRNHIVGIKKVQISFGGNTYDLTRDESNQWQYNAQNTLPVTYLITSIDDDVVELTVDSYSTSTLFESKRNFKIPQNTFFDPATLQKTAVSNSKECCETPKFKNIYGDKFETPYKFINTGGSDNQCNGDKKSGSCALSIQVPQWRGFQFTTGNHQIASKSIKEITFFGKASKECDLMVWALFKNLKKTLKMTTSYTSFSIQLNEIGITESDQYWYGLEFQNPDPSQVTFYFDDIKTVYDGEVCTQKCSDHTSTCNGGGDGDDNSNGNNPSKDEGELYYIVFFMTIALIFI
ncbi:hypothetical protein EIN_305410 [Entamoeba invadens IP1]|uniref:Expansin-like EG45 domain-containing protein n=1 Tax=Entamoeba invadens IP1 TaxID=370355 RepID=A0A0A1TYU2_ENTIV|nr:hypothetical protein EIN_305410 [Entamoeba invadens IP1]ELP86695.1 hypothetical protein EIN_305410 [Entamoeba invadens IP1]|eukprot:XP_004186041.1 hypothetical protein EIN_305410 [Entamoeba invadens IP1]